MSGVDDKLKGESLKLVYMPVREVSLWDKNPKKHDIGSLIRSIEINGFRDPPTLDINLGKTGGLVSGNGRTVALSMMEKQGYKTPRGILTHKDTGEWYMPVHIGVDATSEEMAIAYAIDHNNLTLLGGDLTPIDAMQMWYNDIMMEILNNINVDMLPVSIDPETLQMLNEYNENKNDEGTDEQNKFYITLEIKDDIAYQEILRGINDIIKQRNLGNVVHVKK